MLQRLSDARLEGRRILAILTGSAVNQDGKSNGIMAPNPSAQIGVLENACKSARVDPLEIGYVEAHGTGTSLGDRIEAHALGMVFGRKRPIWAPDDREHQAEYRPSGRCGWHRRIDQGGVDG